MSVELFFLINQLMDFSILAAASRALGLFRLSRVLAASAIAAAYALLPPGFAAPAAQLALLALVSAIIAGQSKPAHVLSAALVLSVCAMASGATARLIARSPGFRLATLVAGGTGAALAAGSARIQRRSIALRPVRLRIDNRGCSTQLDAVIDTGNRLHEPFSGQSVLIASESAVRAIMPEIGFRSVAYGTVGSSGTLRCFRPERIYIFRNGAYRRAPEAWIAVLPQRLPGGVAALAPAEFS